MEQANQKPNTPSYDGSVGPRHLYKYYSFNEYTEAIFTHNQIYFAAPAKFNDPFDSKIDITYDGTSQQRKQFLLEKLSKVLKNVRRRELVAHVKKLIKEGKDVPQFRKALRDSVQKMRTKIGVLSLTQKRANILMWAHYAAQHTGFCLQFDSANPFFDRAVKVGYKPLRPVLNVLQHYRPQEEAEKLLVKAPDWEYEQEWRIVDAVKGPGVQRFPEQALTGVILGCRISQQNKKHIIQWWRGRAYRPILYQASEKEKQFGLDIRKMDYPSDEHG
jgi:hypothetical protein